MCSNVHCSVPWTCVQDTWKVLRKGCAATCVKAGCTRSSVAIVPLLAKVEQMLGALVHANKMVTPDYPWAGELWLRWGFDGLPVWKVENKYPTLTMGCQLRGMKLHLTDRHGFVALI